MFFRAALCSVVLGVVPLQSRDDVARDAWLSMRAQLALVNLKGVATEHIKVSTKNGVVTLYGSVESKAAVRAVRYEVGKLLGVERVDDTLQVIPPKRREAVANADLAVRYMSLERLAKHTDSNETIEVLSVDDGVVMLGGEAFNVEAHAKAVDVVASVPGVKRVESQVEVVNH